MSSRMPSTINWLVRVNIDRNHQLCIKILYPPSLWIRVFPVTFAGYNILLNTLESNETCLPITPTTGLSNPLHRVISKTSFLHLMAQESSVQDTRTGSAGCPDLGFWGFHSMMSASLADSVIFFCWASMVCCYSNSGWAKSWLSRLASSPEA